ncbi:MAG: hypothetical protein ACP5N2_00715 [Candidatus Nanoarchaeia archaeon]
MSSFLQNIIFNGREYLGLENQLQLETERIITGDEAYDSILASTDFSLQNEQNHLSTRDLQLYDIKSTNKIKESTKLSCLHDVLKKLNGNMSRSNGDLDRFAKSYENNVAESIVRQILEIHNDENKNHEVLLIDSNGSGFYMQHKLLPASGREEYKYAQFIEEVKALDVPSLEKIAIVYEIFSKNRGDKKHNDPDELYAQRKEEPLFFKTQDLYSPALIFSGNKAGVCFDRANALVDAYKRMGIDVCMAESKVRKDGTDAGVGHAWVRIALPDADGNVLSFDLDNMWYKHFKMLEPRVEQKTEIVDTYLGKVA